MATCPHRPGRPRRALGVVGVLLLGAVLADQFQVHGVLHSHDLRLWQLLVAVLGVLLAYRDRLVLPRAVVAVTALVVAHSVAVVVIGGVFKWFMAVQIVLVSGCLLVLYSALKVLPPGRLPEIYVLGAKFVAWSIVLEQSLHVVTPALAESTVYSFMGKWDGPLGLVRAHGLMMEPSQVALVLPPAIFVCLVKGQTRTALFLFLSAYLTFSGLTYIGMLAAVVIYLVISRGVRWQMAVMGALVVVLAVAAPPVKERVVATGRAVALIRDQQSFHGPTYFEALRGSVGSVAVATLVSVSAFARNHMLGTGMGQLGTEGERWLDSVRSEHTASLMKNTKLFAKTDTGGSLALRVLGEFGVVGLIAIGLGMVLWFRSLRRLRRIVQFDRNWRADWRLQAIGLFLVLVIPYVVRKDGYLNVYLLLPLMGWLLAVRDLGRVGVRTTSPQPAAPRSPTRSGGSSA